MISARALLFLAAAFAGFVCPAARHEMPDAPAEDVAFRDGARRELRIGDAVNRRSDAPAGTGIRSPKVEEPSAFERRLIGWGPVGVFCLALVDSAMPLPGGPEIALAIVSAKRAAAGYLAAALAVIGSIVGNLVLFRLARKGGESYLERKSVTPRARRFRNWFLRYGLLTVFIPALIPVPPLPEKPFILSAGALGVSTRALLLTLFAARIPRFFGIAYVAASAGRNWRVWFREHGLAMALFAVVLFAALYALIAIKARRNAGTPPPYLDRLQ